MLADLYLWWTWFGVFDFMYILYFIFLVFSGLSRLPNFPQSLQSPISLRFYAIALLIHFFFFFNFTFMPTIVLTSFPCLNTSFLYTPFYSLPCSKISFLIIIIIYVTILDLKGPFRPLIEYCLLVTPSRRLHSEELHFL